ncbi:hypothetical protein DFH09DRAFT_1082849 [Mycena vulgaris]|nr:hypothetical protein DFH09DRAFT_1082849 [Mycena vulgaris]
MDTGKRNPKLLPATRGRVAEESIVPDKIYQAPQPGLFNLLQVKAEPMSLWLSWFTASSKNTSKLEVVREEGLLGHEHNGARHKYLNLCQDQRGKPRSAAESVATSRVWSVIVETVGVGRREWNPPWP